MLDSKLMRQAGKGMYKVNLVKQEDGKMICEILDKNGYYMGSCVMGYVQQFLETCGIKAEIIKRYNKLIKAKYKVK